MSDSLERLYQAVIAAKDLDPATSRTARLFERGLSKMAKKLAEEAIEVAIDAVIRESADLLYNLTVLWASAGVRPEDVWREMGRREDMLGIAEKLPKSAVKIPKEIHKARASEALAGKPLPKELSKELSKATAPPAVRRRIVALEGRSARKRH